MDPNELKASGPGSAADDTTTTIVAVVVPCAVVAALAVAFAAVAYVRIKRLRASPHVVLATPMPVQAAVASPLHGCSLADRITSVSAVGAPYETSTNETTTSHAGSYVAMMGVELPAAIGVPVHHAVHPVARTAPTAAEVAQRQWLESAELAASAPDETDGGVTKV